MMHLTEVGRRHVGIVLRYEIGDGEWRDSEQAQRGEASINQLRWIDALDETVDISHFEYWSQLCWRTLFPVMVRAQPAYRVIRKKTFRRPHILLVVGSIGSGKSSATRYLVRNFGYSEVSSGRQIAKMLGVPPVSETPRAELQEMALRLLRKEGGADHIAEALLTAAKRYDRNGSYRWYSAAIGIADFKARAPMPVAILFYTLPRRRLRALRWPGGGTEARGPSNPRPL